MDELASTEFRKQFAKLEEETLVTVNGHPIGVWMPGETALTIALKKVDALAPPGTEAKFDTRSVTSFGSTPQAQRDDLLQKINRR